MSLAMTREHLYLALCQRLLVAMTVDATSGRQLARDSAMLVQENLIDHGAVNDFIAFANRAYNARIRSIRTAADFIPHLTMLVMLTDLVGASEINEDLKGVSNKGVKLNNFGQQHITNITKHLSLYGAKTIMSEINKANLGDVMVELSKRLRDASAEDRAEFGLKDDASPEDFVQAAAQLILLQAGIEGLEKSVESFASLGAMIFETPVVSDVSAVIEKIMGSKERAAAAAADSATTATSNWEPIVIKPDFESVINSMLATATKERIKDFSEINAAFAKASELAQTVEKLQRKLKSAPSAITVASSESVGKDGSKLTSTVSMVAAADLFTNKGRKSAKLKFDMPRIEWSGKNRDVPEVDESYQFKLAYLLGILPALRDNRNVWLYGHTGTGKSTLVEQIAARLGWPVTRINLDSGIERSDLIGKTELVLDDGKQVTRYVEGLVVHAMRQGHILLLDEVDFGRSDVMYVLQRVLEGKGIQLLEGEKRELVKPHPNFRVIATANTRGQGDELGLYQGAMVQSEAYRDRFTVWIEVDYLSDAQEKEVLMGNVPDLDEAIAKNMIKFANEVRKAFTGGEILQTISPRSLVEMGRAYCFYCDMLAPNDAMTMSIELTTLNKAATDSQAVIKEIARRVFA